ncbi:hypothetical protein KOW79_012667 [Hemibagrus wyckioides]|uniref:Ig-like domain-containing protein n=1 Tax=Hemibagrus wyckioides TaxID=337641 RepID=A0A9D3SHK7_9TELE|nr:hypothetical protein KOW79_012667 [Hemibagrus wyckioides]
MRVLSVTCLLLCVSVHTAHSAVLNQSLTEGNNTFLYCENDGKVIWDKGLDEGRSSILTAEHGDITVKHRPDPDHRYSVLSDLSLLIKRVSPSDSGIYFCNTVPVVNLTVTPLKAVLNQSLTEGNNTFLYCENDGKVIWDKGVDEGRSSILTAEHGDITVKHRPDPDHRYSVLSDLSLLIKRVSPSDSGIYFCNTVPVVNLTVTPLKGGSMIFISILVPATVVVLVFPLFLWKCFFQNKTVKDRNNDQVYESVHEVTVTACENLYEPIYVLAGDPAIINQAQKTHPVSSASSETPRYQIIQKIQKDT